MKTSLLSLFVFVGLLISGCSTAKQSSSARAPVNLAWFKTQHKVVQLAEEDVKKAEFALHVFVKEKGIGPFIAVNDHVVFDRLTKTRGSASNALVRAVREYNARVQAELSVLFGREGLPTSIELTLTVTPINVPPPQKIPGTSKTNAL